MEPEARAADLPDRSVVADDDKAYIKNHPSRTSQWRGTNGSHCDNGWIDLLLRDGAEVLRVGTGEDD